MQGQLLPAFTTILGLPGIPQRILHSLFNLSGKTSMQLRCPLVVPYPLFLQELSAAQEGIMIILTVQ